MSLHVQFGKRRCTSRTRTLKLRLIPRFAWQRKLHVYWPGYEMSGESELRVEQRWRLNVVLLRHGVVIGGYSASRGFAWTKQSQWQNRKISWNYSLDINGKIYIIKRIRNWIWFILDRTYVLSSLRYWTQNKTWNIKMIFVSTYRNDFLSIDFLSDNTEI